MEGRSKNAYVFEYLKICTINVELTHIISFVNKVMHEKSGWIVWNFEYKPPQFLNEDIALSGRFPQFVNVYHVTCTKKGNQHFLKCDCLLYERCGIPCSHIL